MSKKRNKLESFKEIFGMGGSDVDNEESGIVDFQSEKIQTEEIKNNKTKMFRKKEVEKKETVVRDEDISAYQSVIVDLKKYEDCKKIAKYIKNDKVVTLNLEYLDKETAQRIIDFLSGAMCIKGARLIDISANVYVSVPKDMNVYFDRGKKQNKNNLFNLK
ncbi:MAG: cell division protein SepF [Fusobacterium sp. JB021]|nr:cell division protein SepF [Fusobacterium sp. JB021]MDP0506164.1 cell division protein SepF [Fusobacterium sp. JB019]